MYVVTFYSYKGGVGRTMAMVNVAFALAAEGKKVLLVDFDLEAPGLETFRELENDAGTPGLVEFVEEYLRSEETPDVRRFVYQAKENSPPGSVSVMPAGRRDSTYPSRLAGVDWQNLYAQHDGYLMFEDLRGQWETSIGADYVLIDSRTGHTDVGGICTRQLPDAVVILFFPNDQNLAGLPGIVKEIRAEPSRRSAWPIRLHFVASKVPDVDDEEEILARRLERFEKSLAASEIATVHHFTSLSLVEQSVFVLDRPKTRLAAEYRRLSEEVSSGNSQDRRGVIRFLRKIRGRIQKSLPIEEIDEIRVLSLDRRYKDDFEVLLLLVQILDELGSEELAADLLKRFQKLSTGDARLLMARIALRLKLLGRNPVEPLVADARAVLEVASSDFRTIQMAVGTLRSLSPAELCGLEKKPSVRSLSSEEKVRLCSGLLHDDSIEVIDGFLSDLIAIGRERPGELANDVAVILIAAGRYDQAISLLSPEVKATSAYNLPVNFNLAMAKWGRDAVPPMSLFSSVAEKETAEPRIFPEYESPNYRLCLALSAAIAGLRERAEEYLERAREAASRPQILFSAWRYRVVQPAEFVNDLGEIRRLLEKEAVIPRILAAGHRPQMVDAANAVDSI